MEIKYFALRKQHESGDAVRLLEHEDEVGYMENDTLRRGMLNLKIRSGKDPP